MVKEVRKLNITVKLKTIIIDKGGNEVNLGDLDKYEGQTLILKIVQANNGKVMKEYKIKIDEEKINIIKGV